MIQSLLKLEKMPEYLDATDGLAAAVCHSFQKGDPTKKSYTSWKTFINENPERKI
jgi:crossover junction endodeoxyribonuclease RuvC